MDGSMLSRGEELRKSKKYDEAEQIFREAWSKRKHPDVGWRLAHCLRHLDRTDEALRIVEEILEAEPDNLMARREAVWCIYFRNLRPALESENLPAAMAAAKRMTALGADGIALNRAVFSVVKLAKPKRAWRDIVEWTEKLDPKELDKNPRTFGGKSMMAEREQWYFARLKALIELRLYTAARELSEMALGDYPRHRDFARWGALALARLGKPEEAYDELLEIARRDRAPYVLESLAEVAEQAKRQEEALRASCQALTGPGKLQTKIRSIERLARIAMLQGQPEMALRNASLAVEIRNREGWGIRMDLEDLLSRAQQAAPEAVPPTDFKELLAACRTDWEAGCQKPDGEGEGRVTSLPQGKPFAFIKTADGQDVFTSIALIPEACRRKGVRVRVAWRLGFDRKKNRPSLQAVRVSPLEPPASSGGGETRSGSNKEEGFRFDL